MPRGSARAGVPAVFGLENRSGWESADSLAVGPVLPELPSAGQTPMVRLAM